MAEGPNNLRSIYPIGIVTGFTQDSQGGMDLNQIMSVTNLPDEGTTTREQVLDFLGEPDYGKEESAFRYTGKWSDGYIMFGGYGTKSAGLSLIDEKGWWIDISFDESGVVQILSTNSAGPPSF